MEVFIGNLPTQATLEELHRFFTGLELKASFDCRKGQDNKQRCYFYLIARTKDKAEGLALIERLNGQLLLDQPILARPLVARQAESPVPMNQERRQESEAMKESLDLFTEASAEQAAVTDQVTTADSVDRDSCYAEPAAAAL